MTMKKILACLCLQAVTLTDVFSQRLTPIMGWSSWNTYRVNISDTLIMKQANRKMKRTFFLLMLMTCLSLSAQEMKMSRYLFVYFINNTPEGEQVRYAVTHSLVGYEQRYYSISSSFP